MENIPECKPFLDFVKKHNLVEMLRIQPDYTLFIPIECTGNLKKMIKILPTGFFIHLCGMISKQSGKTMYQ
jgi:hypothetical protein